MQSIKIIRRISTLFACVQFLYVETVVAACGATEQMCNGECIPKTSICILEPVPGGPSRIDSGLGFETFFFYINNGVWQWAFRIGVAIAVLNGVAGGFRIVMSNGDSSAVEEGKTRFISSAIGLVILLLSGVILNFINPSGFTT